MATKKTPAREVPVNKTFNKLARRGSGVTLASIATTEPETPATEEHSQPKESITVASTPDLDAPSPVETKPTEDQGPAPAPLPATESTEGDLSKVMVPVQFFFTSAVMEDFKQYTKAVGLSQPMVILQAVQFAYPHLREILGASTVSLSLSEGEESLFDLPTTVARTGDQDGPKNASTTVKMRRSNLDKLDAIHEAVGAPSRNHMVFVAVKYFLKKIH